MDDDVDELARRLAIAMGEMRATSKLAVETFLQVVENPDLRGARLTLTAPERHEPMEARLDLGVDA